MRVRRLAAASSVLASRSLGAAVTQAAPGVRTFHGRTSEGGALTLRLAGQRLAVVGVTVGRYVCRPEGDIGPIRVSGTTTGRIGAHRRFAFTTGAPSERLHIEGQLAAEGRRIGGRLRVRGTMGQDDPCASARMTFSAAR